jgi:hypothetical protein
MSDNESSNQESVTVTKNRGGFSFTLYFRGLETRNAAVYPAEQDALEAGNAMLSRIKTLYLQTLQAGLP